MFKNYSVVSGLVFGLIALAQATRAALQLSVQIGEFVVPVWVSWLAAVVAGGLCIRAFRTPR